jgi:hypothetical protein
VSDLDDADAGEAERWGRCAVCGAARAVRAVLRSVVLPREDIPEGSAWPELILTEVWCPTCGQVAGGRFMR